MEFTTEEVMTAVTELRNEVKKTAVDHDKIEKIQSYLDKQEEKNQILVAAQASIESQKLELVEYKEKLEASGVTESEAKERMDSLEAELARVNTVAAEHGEDGWKAKPEYKALNSYVKEGVNSLDAETKALLRTDSAPDGGYLTTKEMDSEITKKIIEIDPIRSVARVRSISAKSMEMAIRATIPAATYEGEADSGGDDTSKYESETVVPYRQTFTTPITMDLLMDAAFDMDSEISADAAEAFALGEGQGFVSGTGVKQPFGFMSDARVIAGARLGASSQVIHPDDLLLLTGDLKVGYNPVYIFNRRTLAFIRTLKATTNSYLWSPGMDGSAAASIAGHRYIVANSMQDQGANTYPVAFGDFRRGYTITDRTGMSVIRDEFSKKRQAIVEFTMNRWNTGQVTLPEAITVLNVPV